jgi:hypothetical protein
MRHWDAWACGGVFLPNPMIRTPTGGRRALCLTDETHPAKAELTAGLERELESLRGGLEQLEGAIDE